MSDSRKQVNKKDQTTMAEWSRKAAERSKKSRMHANQARKRVDRLRKRRKGR